MPVDSVRSFGNNTAARRTEKRPMSGETRAALVAGGLAVIGAGTWLAYSLITKKPKNPPVVPKPAAPKDSFTKRAGKTALWATPWMLAPPLLAEVSVKVAKTFGLVAQSAGLRDALSAFKNLFLKFIGS